eukprot:887184-Rhodomonas_salina.1
MNHPSSCSPHNYPPSSTILLPQSPLPAPIVTHAFTPTHSRPTHHPQLLRGRIQDNPGTNSTVALAAWINFAPAAVGCAAWLITCART